MVGALAKRVNKAIASFIRLGWLRSPTTAATRSPTASRWRSAPAERADRHRPSRKAMARRQASAASSGRWAGGSGRARSRARRPRSGPPRHRWPRGRRRRRPACAGRWCPRWPAPGTPRGGDRVEGLALALALPVLGDADHPVERDAREKRAGARRLERAHAAHAEPDQADPLGPGRARRPRPAPRPGCRRPGPSSRPCARRASSAPGREGLGAQTTQPFSSARRWQRSSKSGRRPPMSGAITRPAVASPRRAGQAGGDARGQGDVLDHGERPHRGRAGGGAGGRPGRVPGQP